MDKLEELTKAKSVLQGAWIDKPVRPVWRVFSTALLPRWLMLYCEETGQIGSVRDPSPEEWAQAFDAPSAPYVWKDEKRIVPDKEDIACALFGKRQVYHLAKKLHAVSVQDRRDIISATWLWNNIDKKDRHRWYAVAMFIHQQPGGEGISAAALHEFLNAKGGK